MPSLPATTFPPDNDGLSTLHQAAAEAMRHDLLALDRTLTATFGAEAAQATLRVLAVDACHQGAARETQRARFDALGWQDYIENELDHDNLLTLARPWREAAEYAGQGLAPREPFDTPASRADRARRVREVIDYATMMQADGHRLFPYGHPTLWQGVEARAALDFGSMLTLEGVHLLSGVSLGAVRNAVSLGELRPDAAGKIAAAEAKAWLSRRREFCPSRWENLEDGQEPLDLASIAKPDERGMIFVPQDSDGTPFTPEHVVRPAKSGPGLSIMLGAKGAETQYRDFYEALAALAVMDVARWRRRNAAGNWGIVRARGAWVAVAKAEIDRQLAAKTAEAA